MRAIYENCLTVLDAIPAQFEAPVLPLCLELVTHTIPAVVTASWDLIGNAPVFVSLVPFTINGGSQSFTLHVRTSDGLTSLVSSRIIIDTNRVAIGNGILVLCPGVTLTLFSSIININNYRFVRFGAMDVLSTSGIYRTNVITSLPAPPRRDQASNVRDFLHQWKMFDIQQVNTIQRQLELVRNCDQEFVDACAIIASFSDEIVVNVDSSTEEDQMVIV